MKQHPDNYEAHKIVGSLYAEKGRADEALHHLRIAHDLVKNDEEVLIEIGQLEQTDFSAALDAYQKAVKIMKEKNITIPYELWNNIGALYLKLGKHKEAEEHLKHALEVAKASLTEFKTEHATIIYNIARLYESTQRKNDAKDLYLRILKEHPNYIECYLRLGCIAFDAGNMEEALKWCTIATGKFSRFTTNI